MTYEQLKHLKPSSFKRRCGVHRETFEQTFGVEKSALRSPWQTRWTIQTER